METEDFLRRLKEVELSESIFSRVMHAKTVQELIDIQVEPDEMLSYFAAAEEYAKMEEMSIMYEKKILQELKETCPVRKNRRVLFI